ncbi:uncharacterized protein LOC123291701 isoform X2 [Chrysoperla carnea]|nr:uncharacterized protein LOC123291701 isoform X2 [Chrysoperla carnea]XP_044728017.1 uncharacterized protein LOC123291701 isoform X2 [Chrysoperla carnea]
MNGALFRAFTYRKVSLFGSIICFLSIVLLTFSDSFGEYIVVYSILYGVGMGFTLPANALALNTYFDKKRRIATGFSWTATALGPVIMPHLISFLLNQYGVQGSVLLFAGLSANAIVCACLLHPVHWHTKFRDELKPENTNCVTLVIEDTDKKIDFYIPTPGTKMHKSASFISAQYIFNENDAETPGYEIIDPGTPMLCSGNDGLFTPKRSLYGSKQSLASQSKRYNTNYFDIDSKRASTQNLSISRNMSANNILTTYTKGLPYSESKKESMRKRKRSTSKNPKIEENADEELSALQQNGTEQPKTDNGEVLKEACAKLEELLSKQENGENESLLKKNGDTNNHKLIENEPEKEEEEKPTTFWQKIVIFFDLDLLNDPIYVNIMVGITLVWFAELNFSILTPFVLKDFNFNKSETANFMSVVATVDIIVRFLIPFASAKVSWDNRTFFMIGIMSMATGRIFLIATKSYLISLPIAALIGFGKGLRTIFMALAIPSHVPLTRLPAATGLQLLAGGCMSLILGPVVGWIRDSTEDYTLTLHLINVFVFATTASWTIEKLIMRHRNKKEKLKADLAKGGIVIKS